MMGSTDMTNVLLHLALAGWRPTICARRLMKQWLKTSPLSGLPSAPTFAPCLRSLQRSPQDTTPLDSRQEAQKAQKNKVFVRTCFFAAMSLGPRL